MRHGRWVVVCVVLIAFLPTASARAAKRPPCGVKGAETVELTDKVRVVMRTVDHWEERMYACLRGSRRKRTFVSSIDCEIYCSGSLAVTSTYVADYGAEGCYPGSACPAAVRVVDVKSGRRSKGGASAAWLYGFDVNARGTVAWIEEDEYRPGASPARHTEPQPRRVRALTLGGEHLRLDESREIDLYSLAFGYRRLYWMKAGEPQTAAIP